MKPDTRETVPLPASETVREFCAREQISKSLAYRLIKEGKLPVYFVSQRNIRIDHVALRAIRQEQAEKK